MYKYLRCSSLFNLTRRYSSTKSSKISPKANQYAERMIPKRILNASTQTPNFESEEKIEAISKSVQKYLQEFKSNENFFNEKRDEFEKGRLHLANIMGYDANAMTQEDIDKAIQYLFPSGLFEPMSRPVMQRPETIYPKFKTANYDKRGRPYSSFFYTGLANYYESLYKLYSHFEDLNRIEDARIAKGISATEDDKFNKLIYSIKSKAQLENQFIEKLNDDQYKKFVDHLNRLMEHPYSALKSNFLEKFTNIKVQQKLSEKKFEIKLDENDREYYEEFGHRKNLRVLVRVYNKGTGVFLINNKYDLNHFEYFLPREQIMSPLVMANLLDKVDIYVTIDEPVAKYDQQRQAGAIRHGLAKAICAFVDDDTKELLRLNGLLQIDLRTKERKKPGLYRARAKPPHRKR